MPVLEESAAEIKNLLRDEARNIESFEARGFRSIGHTLHDEALQMHSIEEKLSQEAHQLLTPRWRKNRKVRMQRDEWLVSGLTIMSLLVLTPVWNSCVLLNDPAYMYFEGPMRPYLILSGCVAVPCCFVSSVRNVFRRNTTELADERAFIRIGAVMMMALGCILMLCSFEFEHLAVESYVEMFGGCDTGPLTMNLYQDSQMLHAIRARPDCAVLESVELCHGFEDFEGSWETQVLKQMETSYKCSGFCFNGELLGAHVMTQEAAKKKKEITYDDTLKHMEEENPFVWGMTHPYPPTLFSKAEYEYSCDGLTAIRMKHLVGNVGLQSFYLGVILLIGAVAVGVVVITDGWHLHRTVFEWSRDEPEQMTWRSSVSSDSA